MHEISFCPGGVQVERGLFLARFISFMISAEIIPAVENGDLPFFCFHLPDHERRRIVLYRLLPLHILIY
jgi:hypothetical protein